MKPETPHPVSVSAYVGSSKNLKDIKDLTGQSLASCPALLNQKSEARGKKNEAPKFETRGTKLETLRPHRQVNRGLPDSPQVAGSLLRSYMRPW